MDIWLTNEIKELLAQPCLDAAHFVGSRLNNRFQMGQSIDERALTEDVVDLLDESSNRNVWGKVLKTLNDKSIYLTTKVQKSTKEFETGADIGIILERNINRSGYSSSAQYACLIQCKKIDNSGEISDFFHEVGNKKQKQSSLLLDITPSAYYFIFAPTKILHTYASLEPIFFLQAGESSSPIWNKGHFEHNSPVLPLNESLKASSAGILVVPALAVEAHNYRSKKIKLNDLLPNCVPFWYWFAEMFVPAFIGDRSGKTVRVASNVYTDEIDRQDLGVRFSLQISLTTG